jgi:glycosyltransferase involved in cell wall biosynthesis
MRQSLEGRPHALIDVSPLRHRWAPLLRGRKLLTRLLLRKEYQRDRQPLVLEHYARQIEQRLRTEDVDVVFSPSTIPIARLRSSEPIVFWTDAVFAGLVDYYPDFSNLSRSSRAAGDRMERAALERAALAVYSSEWAAEMAVDYYGADPAKVEVVPFGANLERALPPDDVASVVEARPADRCELLFVGVGWLRKGGDVAVEVARRLNRAGLETRLTVIGSDPPEATAFVRPLGFVSKASPEGRSLLERLLCEAHFLILPTRADCTPMVLAEANAFAVPTLTARTGGIPTIVTDGRNGFAFPPEAEAQDYCDRILELLAERARYRALALTAYEEYATRLNWETAGSRVTGLLDRVVR